MLYEVITHAFQAAVVDTLAIKCKRALKQTGLNRLVLAGGVSANRQLRAVITSYSIHYTKLYES